jgi:gluconolactonase
MVTVSTDHLFLEGAVWDNNRCSLVFSDMPANKMHMLRPSQGVETYRSPSNKANGNTLDRVGRLITCEHATSRIVREEPGGSITVLATHYGDRELNSPNDVIVDTAGNIYFTDPTYGRMEYFGVPREPELVHRGVYELIGGAGSPQLLVDDFVQPNGLCLSGDEKHLFVNDSERREIRIFLVGKAGLSGGDVWAAFDQDGGAPDGMKIDSDGNLFCTGPGGIHVFDQTGEHLGVVLVPESVANFTWGDPDLRTLYICASTTLYKCRTRVPGRPVGE